MITFTLKERKNQIKHYHCHPAQYESVFLCFCPNYPIIFCGHRRRSFPVPVLTYCTLSHQETIQRQTLRERERGCLHQKFRRRTHLPSTPHQLAIQPGFFFTLFRRQLPLQRQPTNPPTLPPVIDSGFLQQPSFTADRRQQQQLQLAFRKEDIVALLNCIPGGKEELTIFFTDLCIEGPGFNRWMGGDTIMERFLSSVSSVLMDNQGRGESLLGTIRIAVLPIAKVFTMCFLGFLMASKHVNILPASGRKFLNGLVFTLLLPCLIFSQLGQAITWEKMLEWWFIPFNVVLATIFGSLIGLIVAVVVHPPYPFFKFTIIHIGIGNIGNVPLVLIAALCRDKSNPFGDSDMCSRDGTAYISFGQWVGAIVLYTYVFQMLAPPPEGTFDIEDPNLPLKNPPKNPELVPLLTQETVTTESTVPRKAKIKDFLILIYNKLKLKQIIQPPIIASILAMVIGCVPFLKRLIFTSDAPLFFFTDSCIILGEAMIPCILLALGGNLIDGPGSSKLGFKTTAAIIFGRLVLVPPVGLGIVMLADKLGFFPPGDKMFRFVLLLQYSMPTSVLSGAVANLRGCGRESAAILFWVHIFAVFSMAGWIVLYIHLLF
ncbi:Protein PIN-LIKES 6, variant 2 [Ancistrocladus abbreviatus]